VVALLALLAGVIVAPLPYSAVALALFVLQSYMFIRPVAAYFDLALSFCTVVLLPFVLGSTALGLYSALLAVPALPLLDGSLRRGGAVVQPGPTGPTDVLKAMIGALAAVLLLALLLGVWSLAVACAVVAAYLAGMVVYTLFAVPRTPLETSVARVRVIAGRTADSSVVVRGRSRLPLHVCIDPRRPWIRLRSSQFQLGDTERVLHISVTPPLSGPLRPEVVAVVADPRGLIRRSQGLRPLELQVIPRAKYAEWLAKKFLAQGALQGVPAATGLSSATARRAAGRGVEYMTSRPYVPGDLLRDLDWKRTSKLNQFVVKEYGEPMGVVAILAANLTVKDLEEADELAYTLVTSALTLAGVNATATLVTYNRNEVLLSTKALDARTLVRESLRAVGEITVEAVESRFLQPPSVGSLKSNIARLRRTGVESAEKLAEMLSLEAGALQWAVREHPAARAVSGASDRVHSPALIALISRLNHDTEALLVSLGQLRKEGYDIVFINLGRAQELVGMPYEAVGPVARPRGAARRQMSSREPAWGIPGAG